MFEDWLRVSSAVALPHMGAMLGAVAFTSKGDSKLWYKTLKKHSYMPPFWVFPLGWTVGLTCAGYSSYLVWRNGEGLNEVTRPAFAAYGMHLIFRWAWTPITFDSHSLDKSVLTSLLFTGAALVSIVLFRSVSRSAFWWFLPHLVWCSLSTFFNIKLLQYNS